MSLKGNAQSDKILRGSVHKIALQEKTATENGEVVADAGYNGLSKVVVDVDTPIPDGYIKPSGTKNISVNGQYDVSGYASAVVNVEGSDLILQEKTVTENGEVTPDSGYDGLSKVTVNVDEGISLDDVSVRNVSISATLPTSLYMELSAGGETRQAIVDISSNTPNGITEDIIKKGEKVLGKTGTHEGGGIVPSGTKTIESNGTYNIAEYASVNVNVPTSSGGTVELQNEYCYLDPASYSSYAPTYEFTGALTYCSYAEWYEAYMELGDYAKGSESLVVSRGVISDTFKDLGAGWQSTQLSDVIVPTGRSFIIWSLSSSTSPSGSGLTVQEANFGTRIMNGTTYYGYLCRVESGTEMIILA